MRWARVRASSLEVVETVQLDASGKRRDGAGDQPQQCGLAAGVWSQDGDQLALVGLEGGGFEREQRSRVGARGVGVAGLLDVHAHVRVRAGAHGGIRRRSGSGGGEGGVRHAHASLRRSR